MIALGIGGTSGWLPYDRIAAEGGRMDAARGLEDAAVSDRALELILAGESQVAGAELGGSIRAIRAGAACRADGRAQIRALMARIQEAESHKTGWQKFVEAFTWIGRIVGAAAAVLASVATFGAAVPGVVILGVSLAAAGAGLTSALGGLGVGTYESQAMRLQADRQEQEGQVQQAQEQMSREEAAAQVVLAVEGAMRERALVWMGTEDEGRRTAAAPQAAG